MTLKKLAERKKARLAELKEQLEKNEVRSEDLATVQAEVTSISEDLKEIEAVQSEAKEEKAEQVVEESAEKEEKEEVTEEVEEVKEVTVKDNEQRAAIMGAIGEALATRSAHPTKRKENEIRSAFANFVIGKINEVEARALGIEAGNGSVTVPEVIASEVIAYAQEENLLRKYGTIHRTKGDVKFPVLVKKADAQGHKKERGLDEHVQATGIEFDEILLNPSEFDALATVTKKLLKMTGAPVEKIVIDELKKAYVRKETEYMFNGNEKDNENAGALAKKAVGYYEKVAVNVDQEGWSQRLFAELVKLKNQPVTEVLRKSMWIVNRAALTLLESMVDTTGRPLLHVDATDGVTYKLLGHKLDFTDAADAADASTPVFYFGDFKAFHIQDVVGSMEIQKLTETYASTNRVGFQIYNLLDGQLIYSPFEPAVYRYEIGQAAPVGGGDDAPTPTPSGGGNGGSQPQTPPAAPTVELRSIQTAELVKHANIASKTMTAAADGTVTTDSVTKYGPDVAKTAFLIDKSVTEMTFKSTAKTNNAQWLVIGSDGNNATLVALGNVSNVANAVLTTAGTLDNVRSLPNKQADTALYTEVAASYTPEIGKTYKVVNSEDKTEVFYQADGGQFQKWFTLNKASLGETVKYPAQLGFVFGISQGNDSEANTLIRELKIKKA